MSTSDKENIVRNSHWAHVEIIAKTYCAHCEMRSVLSSGTNLYRLDNGS